MLLTSSGLLIRKGEFRIMHNSTENLTHSEADIKAAAREVVARHKEQYAYTNEIRRTAWAMHTAKTPRAHGFWRHGFQVRFARRVNLQGYTAIPNYDGIAQAIATMFPEFGTDDGTDRLWELLLSPYERIPSGDALRDAAIDLLNERAYQSCE